jgi:hypothetical protein
MHLSYNSFLGLAILLIWPSECSLCARTYTEVVYVRIRIRVFFLLLLLLPCVLHFIFIEQDRPRRARPCPEHAFSRPIERQKRHWASITSPSMTTVVAMTPGGRLTPSSFLPCCLLPAESSPLWCSRIDGIVGLLIQESIDRLHPATHRGLPPEILLA